MAKIKGKSVMEKIGEGKILLREHFATKETINWLKLTPFSLFSDYCQSNSFDS